MWKNRLYILLVFSCIVLTGCYHSDTNKQRTQLYNAEQTDSVTFLRLHHYTRNYNFVVKTDSVMLLRQIPSPVSGENTSDTLTIHRHDNIVVVDIMHVDRADTDSVWVQVARDQYTFGWIPESILLANAVPDDPISQFIAVFSDTHLLVFLIIISLISFFYILHLIFRHNAKVVHFNDIGTFYPTFLALIVAASATFYSSIQLFSPDTWRHFYYHPTLNPFSVSPILSLFLFSIWTMIIVGVAAIDDIFHKLSFGEAILYCGGLVAVCAVNYILFSITTLYYVGYPMLAFYICFALWRYFKYSNCNYLCGNCGANIHDKGHCPYCGAINQ